MTAGYTKWFREELSAHYGDRLIFDNLALGANTCLLGLVTLIEYEVSYDYDLIVIEYSVNDYPMIATNSLDLWQVSFEGLIRMSARRWPKSRICCVMLGRSNVNASLWEMLMSETRRIAAHYPMVILADVQKHVRSSGRSDTEIFADPMHYSAAVQEESGRFLAQIVFHFKQLASSVLPEALHPLALDDAGLLDLSLLEADEKRCFSNSVVRIQAVTLALGDCLHVDVPGAPVCIVFVSTKGCGSFLMSSGENQALIHTLHDGVRDGKIAFMPLIAYGTWWNQISSKWTITFEAIPYTDRPANWPTFHVVPSTETMPVVHLRGCLKNRFKQMFVCTFWCTSGRNSAWQLIQAV